MKPDLATFGKIAGGGLPLGMVCGRREILDLADPKRKEGFVSIGGGTFSENPLTMTAGLATIRHLRKNARTVYRTLERGGTMLREGVDEAMAEAGVEAHTTGLGSLFLTHFGAAPRSAEETAQEDKQMRLEYSLQLMASGIFILPGHPGAVSTSHTKVNIERLAEKSGKIAESLKESQR